MAFTPFEERLMSKVGKHRVSISEIERDFFAIDRPSRRQIQRGLAALVKRGALVQVGEKRGTRYEKAK